MIREGIAILLLCAIFALLMWNIAFYTDATAQLIDLADSAQKLTETEDYSAAAAQLREAARLWAKLDRYTHILIRHSEIGQITDAIYAALGDVSAGEAQRAQASIARLREALSSTAAMEKLTPGSIF